MFVHIDGTLPIIESNTIFVCGSNLGGRHGKGAAKVAHEKFGATYGKFVGLDNRTYHIPTKPKNVYQVLSLNEIQEHINNFVDFTKQHPELFFFITRVGCGLAGYKDNQIAPMFSGISDNCSVAKDWVEFIERG